MINLTTEFYPDRRLTETLETGGVWAVAVREIEDLKSEHAMRILLSVETHLIFRLKLERQLLWQCWGSVRAAQFRLLREWNSYGQN